MITVNTFAPSKPHPGQKEVLAALDSGTRFILLRAGRKWRKTSLMISWLFEQAGKTGLVCPYVAPNRVQAKAIAWNDHVKRILNEFVANKVPYKTNETELSVTLPNGGKVQLLGVENEESLRGISNWGAFCGDEVDDWELDIWPTIIRPNLMTHKAQAIMGGTPKGFRQMFKFEDSPDFKTFHFSSYDNPDLDRNELDSMVNEYQQYGNDYFQQEIMASYTKPTGTVYKEWDMDRQFITLDYDPNLPLHVTWDFGVNDPTVLIWIQPNGAETRVIDYYEQNNSSIEHFVSVIEAKPYKRPDMFTGDPAGKARSITTNTSPIELLQQKGINVRTKDGVTIPDQIRATHVKIPGLFVAKGKAEGFKDCLINYRYPMKKETAFNQENELPIHDKWSHGSRAFEYWCVNETDSISSHQQQINNAAMYANMQKVKSYKWD